LVKPAALKDPSSVTITTRDNYIERKPLSPLKGKTIMLNPGHGCIKDGGIDKGANYKLGKTTIFEMDLNDQVAGDVKRKLELLGAKVIYVDNTGIKAIKDLENKYKPDAFIAIHHDALTKKSSGETMYAHGDKSMALRKDINKFFAADKTIKNNEYSAYVKSRSEELTVLAADSSIPAVLTEIGYGSNPKELKTLITQDYQDKAAQCIVEGIKSYIKKTKKNPPPKIAPWDLVHQVDKKPKFNLITPKSSEKDI